VWAAPWSPPADWKSNGSTINGGSLLPEHRQDWADRLAAFAKSMSDGGIPLVALSAQNEPNFIPIMTATMKSWESCIYTPAELVTFVRDFLGPALAAQGLATPVMAPESKDWTSFAEFALPFASDPAAMAFLGPFATHAYGGGPRVVNNLQATGKPVWQTEVSDPKAMPFDAGMSSALVVAKMIHDSLVGGGVSAWHSWWINPGSATNPDNSGLTGMGALTRRAWVMGNWSRFVRPGFVRVAAEPPVPQTSMYVTAFQDPATGRAVIVAINTADAAHDQVFTIAGASIAELVPWVTSDSLTLAAQPAVPVVDGSFTITLAARSVTSFVSP
jgi:glucuronoarabinoxylan endo-1,4-beta-xylanase